MTTPQEWTQDTLRAKFCHALSEMYRAEVPLYGDLVQLVHQTDTETLLARHPNSTPTTSPDTILPARHRVERHGAIRLGTAQELATIRRLFAVMGMHAVGYYDLTPAGFPMHATAFRPTSPEALSRHPFRVFTTVLRMDLLTARTRTLAERALSQRSIFTDRLLTLLQSAETRQRQHHPALTQKEGEALITEALETFRWHSHATVTLDEYETLKAEHPLIADIVSFPSSHINHLTPRTLDIDAVQTKMREAGLPAKERIEGPPRRQYSILLRQTSFKAREETVFFRHNNHNHNHNHSHSDYIKGTHTARFGEVEQRGFALTPKGRELYDAILARVNADAAQLLQLANDDAANEAQYEQLLVYHFQSFPDELSELWSQKLAYFCYSVASKAASFGAGGGEGKAGLAQLVQDGVLEYEPIKYEDFLPLSAGGIFSSNLGSTSLSGRLVMEAGPDVDGFQRMLGGSIADEFALYECVQAESLERCCRELGLEKIDLESGCS
ncbi:DUF1338 domain protein [Aspergillus homomorphus CBS 101889]|uniref:2-oxoadipate dioxygenase/decarboxylase n=1 Tax=Aspergillus homomorphus (strain CBS 101889) TaxID=1450537 RepID=A0A395HY10_ASPHC|nr:DUF1338 domain protein [Aspergillus homomorphus CBS 101889]RAL12325.1 DUF1338 domain protein [Aspergillus homomorphus CBS 101889]